MASLFSEFSMLWVSKALAQRAQGARDGIFAPFETLHAIRWSAPWRIVAAECDGRASAISSEEGARCLS